MAKLEKSRSILAVEKAAREIFLSIHARDPRPTTFFPFRHGNRLLAAAVATVCTIPRVVWFVNVCDRRGESVTTFIIDEHAAAGKA